ncbi:polysaccharide biosynthesis/export family protein [Pontibacter sp. BAB1700]|uniref:polysaccharide biosynthesis/export family protein n=1 Tax=Pontibacter sp. BAB1700 TaxID=1144253 RepID=UPI00026BE6B8|nr:polysaccharide biosynthesis/export family protein [Pontibacter sp. BAB1700]EJF09375.1 Soluble ligand binding domain containing protein [Pontibacter sp. BAB1700]
MKIKLVLFLSLLFFASCSSLRTRNIVYFSDLEQKPLITEQVEMKRLTIKPGDLLSIDVLTPNMETNMLFNRGIVMEEGGTGGGQMMRQLGNENEGYLVDTKGTIDFPVLGNMRVQGLTTEQVRDTLMLKVHDYVQDPIVKVRLQNFRFTMMGETGPRVVDVPADNEEVNLLEGLAMAGGISIYGKMNNVLVIREQDGQRTMARLNLNSKETLASPYFYLQQNDIVYVEPDKAKIAGTSFIRRNWAFAVGLVSSAFVLYRLFQ